MFIEECCEIKEGAECLREQLLEKYQDFCRKNGFKCMSQTTFNKDVESIDGVERGKDKMSRRSVWKGLMPAN